MSLAFRLHQPSGTLRLQQPSSHDGMKEMNGKVHDAILKRERLSNEPEVFADRVERHITSPEFQRALGLGDTAAPPSATAASATAAQLQKS